MDFIKEAFQKVKQDIDLLGQEINFLRSDLIETREKMTEICKIIIQINKKINYFDKNTLMSTSTNKTIIPTISTHSSTDNLPLEALNSQNIPISIGNQGASTDRQTDRQTDRKEENSYKSKENSIDDAVEILNSLDNIKKEIRLKFKKLTNQELLIFSTIYQLDDERGYSDYQTIAKKLNLTESSIRDYVGRIIKKGISIDKNKINNKNIQLSIPQNLKKIATLYTILQHRDL
jgi:hypothetical protein